MDTSTLRPQRKASEHCMAYCRVPSTDRKRSDSMLANRQVSLLPLRNERGYRYSVVSLSTNTNPFVDISSQCMKVVASSNRLSKLLSRDDSEKNRTPAPLIACTSGNSEDLPDTMMNGPIIAEEGEPSGSLKDLSRKKSSIAKDSISSMPAQRRSTIFSGKQRLLFLRERRIKNSMDKSGKRLGIRSRLYQKRQTLCDMSLAFAMAGICLMLVENELTAVDIVSKESFTSTFLRQLVLVTTVILNGLIVGYHASEVKLVMIDSGTDDWRVAISVNRMLQIALELVICSICPLPWTGSTQVWFIFPDADRRDVKTRVVPATVPTDVFLSIPMMLHTATRTIASLNRISVDFKFVVKTMMTEEPILVIVVFTLFFWVALCWVLTQCERYNPSFIPSYPNSTDVSSHTAQAYLDSLWLIVITFMSIGYGDVIPHTICGRAVSITSGVIGVGVASALVAVVARKLELTRAEKHVNVFLAETKTLQKRKNAAAMVLQQTWFIHRSRKESDIGDEIRLRFHQRKFLSAITEFRRAKWEQRRTDELSNQLVDIVALQKELQEMAMNMLQNQASVLEQLGEMHSRIDALTQTSRFRHDSVDSMRSGFGPSRRHRYGPYSDRSIGRSNVLWEPLGTSKDSVDES